LKGSNRESEYAALGSQGRVRPEQSRWPKTPSLLPFRFCFCSASTSMDLTDPLIPEAVISVTSRRSARKLIVALSHHGPLRPNDSENFDAENCGSTRQVAVKIGGASRDRTDDLIVANDGVCQSIYVCLLRLTCRVRSISVQFNSGLPGNSCLTTLPCLAGHSKQPKVGFTLDERVFLGSGQVVDPARRCTPRKIRTLQKGWLGQSELQRPHFLRFDVFWLNVRVPNCTIRQTHVSTARINQHRGVRVFRVGRDMTPMTACSLSL
jgi:hypothetical protein